MILHSHALFSAQAKILLCLNEFFSMRLVGLRFPTWGQFNKTYTSGINFTSVAIVSEVENNGYTYTVKVLLS